MNTTDSPVKGLYGIADISGAAGRTEVELAEAYLAAGVTVLQLRMKEASREAVREVLAQIAPRAREAGCSLVLNDDPGLASEFPGVGVHLGQGDVSPVEARATLGEGPLIGWSTHDLADVQRAAELPVDYIGFGPIFSAMGKHLSAKDHREPMVAVGLASLSHVVAEATVPVVAIGGIDKRSLVSVMQTGACAAAVISAVSRAAEPRLAALELAETARQHQARTKGS